MKSALGGGKDLNMTVTLQGPMWVVKGAPGTADYSRFFKAAVEKRLDLQRSSRRQGAARASQGDG